VVAHKCAQLPETFTEVILVSRTQARCDAIAADVKALQGRVIRDAEWTTVARAFEARLERIAAASGVAEDDYRRLRFAVEELRVALFAEPVGTRGKVSPKRLAREFLDLERSLGLA